MRHRGRRRGTAADGFTLIEILVVVVIIGILATVFGLSIDTGSADEHVRTEAKRLQQILKLAAEEAETKGVQIGFRYTTEGYEFLAIDQDGQWAVIEDDSPLHARELGRPYSINLRVDGRQIAPAVPRDADHDAPIAPQVLILSSGELTPFLLWLTMEQKPQGGEIVQGSLTGEITTQPWSRETWSERAAKAKS